MRKYAGIGSRKTPQEIQDFMTEFGRQSARKGWLLRSGHAPGADQAFERGCVEEKGRKEIFLPWEGFEGAPENDPDYIVPPFSQERLELAMKFHRKWRDLGPGGEALAYAQRVPDLRALHERARGLRPLLDSEGPRWRRNRSGSPNFACL